MAAAVTLATGCKDGTDLTPRSGGLPYEVVVAGEDGEATARMKEILGAITVGELPQEESAFDISATSGATGAATKYARNIVITDIDASKYDATRVRYEKNVYARPQIVIRVCAPSAERLQADSAQIQKAVGGLLERFELNTEIGRLLKTWNRAADRTVDSLFGRGIRIAPDITAMKRGSDFVWLSDNSATAMRNICVYSYPGLALDAGRAVRMRDSVMRANIPGETPRMYMCTTTVPAPSARMLAVGRRQVMETRGLWEMKGDAMGGPFVSHSIVDSLHGRIIVAEAFVFAPGKKKRNIVKQLEAALYTLK